MFGSELWTLVEEDSPCDSCLAFTDNDCFSAQLRLHASLTYVVHIAGKGRLRLGTGKKGFLPMVWSQGLSFTCFTCAFAMNKPISRVDARLFDDVQSHALVNIEPDKIMQPCTL